MPLLGQPHHQTGIRHRSKLASRRGRDNSTHEHSHHVDNQRGNKYRGIGNLDNAGRMGPVWGHRMDRPDCVCIAVHLHIHERLLLAVSLNVESTFHFGFMGICSQSLTVIGAGKHRAIPVCGTYMGRISTRCPWLTPLSSVFLSFLSPVSCRIIQSDTAQGHPSGAKVLCDP